MSQIFRVRPAVAGGLGEHTIMDTSQHPLVVERLHYVFAGWGGDDLVESFPCFLVTARLATSIDAQRLTGVRFAEVEVSIDPQLAEMEPSMVDRFPPWRWLQPIGCATVDDFWVDDKAQLYVSSRARELLSAFDMSSAHFELV